MDSVDDPLARYIGKIEKETHNVRICGRLKGRESWGGRYFVPMAKELFWTCSLLVEVVSS